MHDDCDVRLNFGRIGAHFADQGISSTHKDVVVVFSIGDQCTD